MHGEGTTPRARTRPHAIRGKSRTSLNTDEILDPEVKLLLQQRSSDSWEEGLTLDPKVQGFLTQYSLQRYGEILKTEDVMWEDLLTFTDDDFREMEIPLGARKRFLRGIKEHLLKQEQGQLISEDDENEEEEQNEAPQVPNEEQRIANSIGKKNTKTNKNEPTLEGSEEENSISIDISKGKGKKKTQKSGAKSKKKKGGWNDTGRSKSTVIKSQNKQLSGKQKATEGLAVPTLKTKSLTMPEFDSVPCGKAAKQSSRKERLSGKKGKGLQQNSLDKSAERQCGDGSTPKSLPLSVLKDEGGKGNCPLGKLSPRRKKLKKSVETERQEKKQNSKVDEGNNTEKKVSKSLAVPVPEDESSEKFGKQSPKKKKLKKSGEPDKEDIIDSLKVDQDDEKCNKQSPRKKKLKKSGEPEKEDTKDFLNVDKDEDGDENSNKQSPRKKKLKKSGEPEKEDTKGFLEVGEAKAEEIIASFIMSALDDDNGKRTADAKDDFLEVGEEKSEQKAKRLSQPVLGDEDNEVCGKQSPKKRKSMEGMEPEEKIEGLSVPVLEDESDQKLGKQSPKKRQSKKSEGVEQEKKDVLGEEKPEQRTEGLSLPVLEEASGEKCAKQSPRKKQLKKSEVLKPQENKNGLGEDRPKQNVKGLPVLVLEEASGEKCVKQSPRKKRLKKSTESEPQEKKELSGIDEICEPKEVLAASVREDASDSKDVKQLSKQGTTANGEGSKNPENSSLVLEAGSSQQQAAQYSGSLFPASDSKDAKQLSKQGTTANGEGSKNPENSSLVLEAGSSQQQAAQYSRSLFPEGKGKKKGSFFIRMKRSKTDSLSSDSSGASLPSGGSCVYPQTKFSEPALSINSSDPIHKKRKKKRPDRHIASQPSRRPRGELKRRNSFKDRFQLMHYLAKGTDEDTSMGSMIKPRLEAQRYSGIYGVKSDQRASQRIPLGGASLLANDLEKIKIYNCRDLSTAVWITTDKAIKPNLIFRSACVSRGVVSEREIIIILAYLENNLGIRTIIDFRNKDEKEEDPFDMYVEKMYPTVRKKLNRKISETSDIRESRLRKKTRGLKMVNHNQRYNIPLMNIAVKVKGLFWGASDAQTKMKMAQAASDKAEVTRIFAEEAMNRIGLDGLNKLMLKHAGVEICRVLKICANSHNFPILYHCSSGKDRTGLISALILHVCGLCDEDIIENYHQSEIFLRPVITQIREENSKKGLIGFDGTPSQVMRKTLRFIRKKWDTIDNYLDSIGFVESYRIQLREAMHSAELTGSSHAWMV